MADAADNEQTNRGLAAGPADDGPPARVDGSLRESLRRSTWALGGVVFAAMILAGLTGYSGFRATQNQRRAELAELDGRERLWKAYLAQARAARLSGTVGRRADALRAIRSASTVQVCREVRDEAIAGLVLSDLELKETLVDLPSGASQVEVAPGLNQYAVGGYDADFRIFNASDSRELLRLDRQAAGLGPMAGRDRRVWGYLFSADGNYFAMSLRDGSVAAWSLSTGEVMFRHASTAPRATDIHWSFEGQRLAFYDFENKGRLVVVEVATGRECPSAGVPAGAPFEFMPGTNQAVVAIGSTLQLVRLDSGEFGEKVEAPERIKMLAVSADGLKIAAASETTDVYLWNREVRRFFVLRNHTERNSTLQFSPGSDRLLSSSLDNVTIFWDCGSGREVVRMSECNGLSFSADGQRVACLTDRTKLSILQFVNGGAFRTVAGPGELNRDAVRVDLSPDGRWFGAVQQGGLAIWDLEPSGHARFFSMPETRSLAFLPDGRSLLTGGTNSLVTRFSIEPRSSGPGVSPDFALSPAATVAAPENISIRHIAAAPDGRSACLDLNDRRIVMVDLEGKQKPVFLNPGEHLTYGLGGGGITGSGRFAISPDGQRVAFGYGPGKGPLVFDAHQGTVFTNLPAFPGSLVFSHDGRYLLTCGEGEYQMWRTADWQKVWQRGFPALGALSGAMCFSGDDKWLAATVSRHHVGLLDTATGQTLATLTPPDPQAIVALRLSLDNRRLVAALYNNVAQIWDLDLLKAELQPLGVDLTTPLAGFAFGESATKAAEPRLIKAMLAGIVAPAVTAILAALALRRHRRLAEEFVRTEALGLEQEQELKVQRELNRLKSNFVSMVSHEFRTPLGVIQSNAEILEAYSDRLKPEQRAQHLAEITQFTTRMKDLMEEVLLLSRAESGRMECCLGPVDLKQSTSRVVDQIRQSTERRCPIEAEFTGVPETVRLDGNLVEIILSNLISNAVKYSEPGSPVRVAVRGEPGVVILEVQDRGIGIPAADQPGLFSSFHRAANAVNIPGTGLGLTILKRCVDLHLGTISFRSAEGEGSTFVVRLPC